jgi:hypothetical protein
MAISTQAAVLAKRRALNAVSLGYTPETERFIKTLFETLSQIRKNPDLQVVEFDLQTSAASDAVIADAACKVYAIVTKKANATAAFLKGSDHASAGSATAPEFELELNAADERVALFPAGWAMGTGFTLASHTTSDGSTDSTAGDGPKGIVIIGAA